MDVVAYLCAAPAHCVPREVGALPSLFCARQHIMRYTRAFSLFCRHLASCASARLARRRCAIRRTTKYQKDRGYQIARASGSYSARTDLARCLRAAHIRHRISSDVGGQDQVRHRRASFRDIEQTSHHHRAGILSLRALRIAPSFVRLHASFIVCCALPPSHKRGDIASFGSRVYRASYLYHRARSCCRASNIALVFCASSFAHRCGIAQNKHIVIERQNIFASSSASSNVPRLARDIVHASNESARTRLRLIVYRTFARRGIDTSFASSFYRLGTVSFASWTRARARASRASLASLREHRCWRVLKTRRYAGFTAAHLDIARGAA